MHNFDSYLDAENCIKEGAYETMRSDVSVDCAGQEHFIVKCYIIGIPHTFYMIADHDNYKVIVDHVRQGHSK